MHFGINLGSSGLKDSCGDKVERLMSSLSHCAAPGRMMVLMMMLDLGKVLELQGDMVTATTREFHSTGYFNKG